MADAQGLSRIDINQDDTTARVFNQSLINATPFMDEVDIDTDSPLLSIITARPTFFTMWGATADTGTTTAKAMVVGPSPGALRSFKGSLNLNSSNARATDDGGDRASATSNSNGKARAKYRVVGNGTYSLHGSFHLTASPRLRNSCVNTGADVQGAIKVNDVLQASFTLHPSAPDVNGVSTSYDFQIKRFGKAVQSKPYSNGFQSSGNIPVSGGDTVEIVFFGKANCSAGTDVFPGACQFGQTSAFLIGCLRASLTKRVGQIGPAPVEGRH